LLLYMSRFSNAIFIAVLAVLLVGCGPGRSTLKISKVPNYDKAVSDHIFFLDFRVTAENQGDREKVELVKAISGSGRMKNILRPVHYPYQIKAIPRYTTSALEKELVFEHPLFNAREVSEPGGTITKVAVTNTEGIVSMRLQEAPGLDRLELYSVTPEKGTVKIYTLRFKP
jgi:hypothetical protein